MGGRERNEDEHTEAVRLQAMIEAYQGYADGVGVVPPDLDELLRSMGIERPQG